MLQHKLGTVKIMRAGLLASGTASTHSSGDGESYARFGGDREHRCSSDRMPSFRGRGCSAATRLSLHTPPEQEMVSGKVLLNQVSDTSKLKVGFEKAYSELRTRGPDEKGTWSDDNSFFLHTCVTLRW